MPEKLDSFIKKKLSFARQPCCIRNNDNVLHKKEHFSYRKNNLLFLPRYMPAVQNFYTEDWEIFGQIEDRDFYDHQIFAI